MKLIMKSYKKISIIKLTSTISLLLVSSFIAFAQNGQRVPSVQQISLRAPADIKIDGDVSEWNNQFQAFNRATNLFYTIANDDENLYLVVKATAPRIIEKILDVGITLTVNNTGKKSYDAKENIAITYPRIKWSYVYNILRKTGNKSHWIGHNPRISDDVLTRTDSTVSLANKTFSEQAKSIKVDGISGIADTAISVYNEQGINVAAIFANNGIFIYELAVPLKYLRLSISKPEKFYYSIKLADWDHPLADSYSSLEGGHITMLEADPDLNSTTDFWGEYTLAKK